ncbi:helix-turn-helix domain-containing protein [bacterium]|nr:helix-turn-helix domain-containing protein [bacterium]
MASNGDRAKETGAKEDGMNRPVGPETVDRLRAFTEALENGSDLSEVFTCRKIVLDLRPEAYSPELVKQTRELLNLSQTLFAEFLGVSRKTVQAWEQGTNPPQDIACRFMDEIRLNSEFWKKRVKESIRVTQEV